MNNWSIEDLKRKGLVQKNYGSYIPVKSLVSKKVQKLPNLLERASLQSVPDNSLIGKDEIGGKIFIKPLSNNKAWRGRRFKTDEHNKYCLAVTLLLPNNIIVPEGLLRVYYEFGVSSAGADWDNNIKSFQDVLSKKYGFNDNRIMEANIKKVLVKKEKEYIIFKIEAI
jgi:hypothetical protein